MLNRLLAPTRALAIAHRGGSTLRPENTMAAFDHAAALGVDALECDVRLSKDDVPVVIHDSTLDRTTDRTGPVAALTADELARVDAGWHFGPEAGYPHRGRGYGVPRLVDLLARHPTLPFIIEIKSDAADLVVPVFEAVDRAGAVDRVIIGAFSQAVLDRVRRHTPRVPTSASRAEIASALRRTRFGLRPKRGAYDLVQAPYYFRGRRIFGRRFVTSFVCAGLPVQAWIVDEESDMRTLIDWGVTGIISDRPDRAVQVVNSV
ncbi:MAG TPA: glycerophosphodiester phosphodiesterase [Vicinamibacterales bacterium]|nr:glycerophosphodiester phosphodiesterase [Vicinamibacterales bacterium]